MYGALYSAGSKSAHVCTLSCVWLFVTPWTVAHKAHLSMELSRQDYWSGLLYPSPGDILDPGIEPGSYHIAGRLDHLSYQGVKVAQLCLTLWDPMDYTVPGILQARKLEWVAFSFSRGSSQPEDQTQVSHIAGGFFTVWTTREAQATREAQTDNGLTQKHRIKIHQSQHRHLLQ